MPGTRAGDIIQVMGDGFMIGERLLRPAQVGVSAGGPAAVATRAGTEGLTGRCLPAASRKRVAMPAVRALTARRRS